MKKTTEDLFAPPDLQEIKLRKNEPKHCLEELQKHLDYLEKRDGKVILTPEEKERIKSMIPGLLEFAENEPGMRENFKVLYLVFLGAIVTYIKKCKNIDE